MNDNFFLVDVLSQARLHDLDLSHLAKSENGQPVTKHSGSPRRLLQLDSFRCFLVVLLQCKLTTEGLVQTGHC